MRSVHGLARQIAGTLAEKWRPLLAFHLFFTLLAAVVLLPATGWLLTFMLTRSGDVAVTNHELFAFIFSGSGIAWLLAAGTLFACMAFVQHAGMMVIASAQDEGATPSRPYGRTVTALVHVGHKLPRLLKLAATQVVAHLLIAAPFVAVIAGLFKWLLGDYDIYFVVNEKPAALWQFLLAAAPFAGALLLLNGNLYVRWLLALPELMLDHVSPRRALIKSHRLTRGWRLRLAAKALLAAALVPALPALAVFTMDAASVVLLGGLPEVHALLIPATVALLMCYIVFTFLAAFLAISVNSLLIYSLYARTGGRQHPPLPAKKPRQAGLLSWSVEILLLAFALGQAIHVVSGFDFDDDVLVIAHRGSSAAAPENTLAAMQLALAEGADVLETDVRLTADGTPVLLHDDDLRRIAGMPRRIEDVSDSELEDIDAGSWFEPRFGDQRVLALSELIDLAGRETDLLVEIKPGRDTAALIRATVETLRTHQALRNTTIGAMNSGILREAKALAPEIRTALFIHTGIGAPDRLEFDALGLRAATVDSRHVVTARRNGYRLYVWTVNDRSSMSRFIDMGVDGIITDHPGMLRELLEERAALSDAERLLIKLRNWLRS